MLVHLLDGGYDDGLVSEYCATVLVL